jgi:hypothetical protein
VSKKRKNISLISCPPEDTTNAPAALERCLSSVSCNTSTTLDPKSALACRRELRPDDSSLCRASYVLFSGGGDQRLLNTGDTTRNRARRGLTNLLPSQWNCSEIQIFLLFFFSPWDFLFFPFLILQLDGGDTTLNGSCKLAWGCCRKVEVQRRLSNSK